MAAGLIGAGIGAGAGLINQNQKVGQYNRDKQLAADIERNSAWTGVHGQMPQNPGSAFGAALQGGLGGAMMGSQFGAAAPVAGASAPLASVGPGVPAAPAPQSAYGGSNPFGLDQNFLQQGQSSWNKPTLYGQR